jgi:hypothetical protein
LSTGKFWYRILSISASKDDLVPPVPVLTRYKKETAIKVFVKKELFDSKHLDERRSINIDVPATAMLCVQLNTLHYAVSQLSKLEDSMWLRWIAKKPREKIVISMEHLCAYSMLKFISQYKNSHLLYFVLAT